MTGRQNSGKTTLLSSLFPSPIPGITTWAVPGSAVFLRDHQSGKTAPIGLFDPALPGKTCRMKPLADGFLRVGIPALNRCAQEKSDWILIDEIGYLESSCPDYIDALLQLMEQKRIAAAVRKQDLPFLSALRRRDDVFLVDLDDPFPRSGCVIMASGFGRRFGGNKLMAPFQGKPLIQWVLESTASIFSRRIVVTRHESVRQLCREQGIAVRHHDLPSRSDTIRLGLEAMSGEIDSCMFCPADQPLLSQDTIAALALSAANDAASIWRTSHLGACGSPVLFPEWTFSQLLSLSGEMGGNAVVRQHPDRVRLLSLENKWELADIDTPDDLQRLSDEFGSFLSGKIGLSDVEIS